MAILMYLFCHSLFSFDVDTPALLSLIINGALLENWEFENEQQSWLHKWQQRLYKETFKEINVYIYMKHI